MSLANAISLRGLDQSRFYLAAILLSLALSFLRAGPLSGSVVALIVVILCQLFFPGYLLARLTGKLESPHPVSRFAWVLACGLALTICLAVPMRVLRVPFWAYLLILHSLMLGMALLPIKRFVRPHRSISWSHLAHYLGLGFCCITVFLIGYDRTRYRFVLFDPDAFSVYINLATSDPDLVQGMGLRLDIDGWTYTEAAWSWVSGVSGADLIWHDQTALFVWMVPLAVFALALELTGRESAGVWSAAALTIVGLMTVGDPPFVPLYVPLGRYALFELTTIRMVSTALVLPLALMVGLRYIRTGTVCDLILFGMMAMSTASLHPRQALIVGISVGATLVIRSFSTSLGRSDLRLLALVGIIGIAAFVVVLRSLPVLPNPDNGCSLTITNGIIHTDSMRYNFGNIDVRVIENLPLIGTTYIIDPGAIFYHPALIVALCLGLASPVYIRKRRVVQYIFGATVATLLIPIVPALAHAASVLLHIPMSLGNVCRVNEVAFGGILGNLVGIGVFMLPVALTLGLSFDLVVRRLGIRFPAAQSAIQWLTPLTVIATILVLLVEPIPIPASARDQLTAFNDGRNFLAVDAAQDELVAYLRSVLPTDERHMIVAPDDVFTLLSESIPRTIGTHLEEPVFRPWLDTADIGFLDRAYTREYVDIAMPATHFILKMDDPRLPQVVLRIDRFEHLANVADYVVFRIRSPLVSDEADDLFAQMNSLYTKTAQPRWDGQMFALVRPGDSQAWEPIIAAWQRRLHQKTDDFTLYGLAMAYMLSGNDTAAFPLWNVLHQRYPGVALVTDAYAFTQAQLGRPEDGVQALLQALDSPETQVRLMVVKSLLTDSFSYLLSDSQIEKVTAVTDGAFPVWRRLVGASNRLASYAELVGGRGRWDVVERWLGMIPPVHINSRQYATQGLAMLAQGQVELALEHLKQATDPDWLAVRQALHPDRWANNVAAQAYYLLQGELALRGQRYTEAQQAFGQAVNLGSRWAGRYFLAQAYRAAGDADRADHLRASLDQEWLSTYRTPMPELVSLMAIADYRALYVAHFDVVRGEDDDHIIVNAILGRIFAEPYPVQTWRFLLLSQTTGEQVAFVDKPSVAIDGALVRITTSLTVDGRVPSLTPATLVVQPRYSNAVILGVSTHPLVLNRPPASPIDSDSRPLDKQFGRDIRLLASKLEADVHHVQLTLYWQAEAMPDADYQVTVQVISEAGSLLLQNDTAPAGGNYPTSEWRLNTTIADVHTLTSPGSLPPGTYRIGIGLYRLSDMQRLTIKPGDSDVKDNLLFLQFTVPGG